ncbi:MAG: MtaA/CmuA family methyltransferase [Defluviitaleaceae bacterium]|nr:MtaA/CmuA family methyltransferase [Defluviitaleaceae bacterium]
MAVPQMTPYERVMAAIARKEVDVFPVINPVSVATVDGMRLSNAYFPEAHTDPAKMAALAAVGHEHFNFDSVAPYYSVHLEAAALGAQIDWRDAHEMPQVTAKAISRLDDFELPAKFMQRSELQKLLRAIGILKKKYTGRVPIIGKVIGPWTLAYNIYGVENLTLDMILEPKKTAEFIKELSVVSVKFAKEQFAAGADIVTWAEHATSDLVSPHIYSEFLLPVHQKAAFALQCDGPMILHLCGNVMDRLSIISKSGFQAFHLHSRNDFPEAVKAVGDDILIIGGVSNPLTLNQGTPKTVQKEVSHILRSGISIVAPECALPSSVPEQNLLELTRAVHQHSMNI